MTQVTNHAKEGRYILFAELDNREDAALYMSFKLLTGWEIVSLPFPSNFEMVDSGEETTEAHPRTWCVIMHRRPQFTPIVNEESS